MTAVERWIAKLGIAGVLAILLMASTVANVWFLRKLAEADARCATRIDEAAKAAAEAAGRRDAQSVDIGRETADAAADDAQTIQVETIRYVDRIREVPVYLPAECDGPIADRVRDALKDAAASANR